MRRLEFIKKKCVWGGGRRAAKHAQGGRKPRRGAQHPLHDWPLSAQSACGMRNVGCLAAALAKARPIRVREPAASVGQQQLLGGLQVEAVAAKAKAARHDANRGLMGRVKFRLQLLHAGGKVVEGGAAAREGCG